MSTIAAVDRTELEAKVKDMYRHVAARAARRVPLRDGPQARRAAGLRAGRSRSHPRRGDRIVRRRRLSLRSGRRSRKARRVLDLGSGSGMDTFIAALKVGPRGRVVGVDMTDEQRAKAERLRDRAGFANVSYLKGYIESIPMRARDFDVVISNGVINLSADKAKVFARSGAGAEARRPARTVRHRDRGAVARGHRLQRDAVGGVHRRRECSRTSTARRSRRQACEVTRVVENTAYQFISPNAQAASGSTA